MKRPIIFLREDAEKHMPQKRLKSQSAMEYLMTYGWAILIIAVVLGALFSMGFFNSASLAPKVQPGACQVERPYGPGTSAYASIQGICNNQLPQYVAQFHGGLNQFVNTSQIVGFYGGTQITVTAWVYVNNTNLDLINGITYIGPASSVCGGSESLAIGTDLVLDTCNSGFFSSFHGTSHSWNFVAYTLNGNQVTLYLNGMSSNGLLTGSGPIPLSNPYFAIGNDREYYPRNSINGSIADVQVYNATLSSAAIDYLYHEGIGGVPTDLPHLVGWWPLNGNANDYSGNQNSGTNSNVIYTNNWASSYSAP